MANTISLTNEIVANQVIEKFGSLLAPISALSTSFEPKIGEAGSTVSVGLVDVPVSGQVFGGDYTAQSDSTINKVQVPLTHFYRSFKITDAELTSSSAAKLENLIGVHAKALARTLFSNVTAQLQTGSAGFGAAAVRTGSASFDLAQVKIVRSACDAAGMDMENRTLILDSAYYTNVLPTASTTITTESVTEGAMPRVYGFDTYSVNWPSTSAQPVVGAAIHPSAVAVAARLPECQGKDKLEAYEVITVPGVNFPVAYRQWYDANAGTKYGSLEVMFGAKLANVSGAKLITSS